MAQHLSSALSTSPTCSESLSVAGVAVDRQFLRESDNIINVFLHFVQVSSIESVTVWCSSQSHSPQYPPACVNVLYKDVWILGMASQQVKKFKWVWTWRSIGYDQQLRTTQLPMWRE